ncbi:hypothetical protein ALC62_05412 [Cyphomyrmex costatus]|uniref:Uncharacterized protein n=1 Tax=Cyphomyrmex costatus TaxID=456900 RepID=A0A195CSP8_9HYME|nr:hypothetical protein ALC62_05412 [Cyphomyrmex costatus]
MYLRPTDVGWRAGWRYGGILATTSVVARSAGSGQTGSSFYAPLVIAQRAGGRRAFGYAHIAGLAATCSYASYTRRTGQLSGALFTFLRTMRLDALDDTSDDTMILRSHTILRMVVVVTAASAIAVRRPLSFESVARHIFGAGIVGRQIDLSLDLVDYVLLLDKIVVRSSERFSNQSGLLCEMEKVYRIRTKRKVCLSVWAKFLSQLYSQSMNLLPHNDNVCNWSGSQLVNTSARCAKRKMLHDVNCKARIRFVLSCPNTEYSCRIRATAYNAQDNYTGMSVVRVIVHHISLYTKLCLHALTRLTLHLRLAHLIELYKSIHRNSPTCSNLMQYIRSRLEFSEPFPPLYRLSDRLYFKLYLPISRSTSEQPQHRYNLHKTLWSYKVSANFEIYSYRVYRHRMRGSTIVNVIAQQPFDPATRRCEEK